MIHEMIEQADRIAQLARTLILDHDADQAAVADLVERAAAEIRTVAERLTTAAQAVSNR